MQSVRSVESATRLLTSVVAVARENQLTTLAAGLAYYAFNSLIPLFILVVVGVAVSDELSAAARLVGVLSGVDAGTVEPVLRDVIGNTAGRRRAAVLAAGILLWSSLRMFQAVNNAFGAVYETRKQRSSVRSVLDTLLVLGTVAVALGLLVVVGVALSFVAEGVLWGVATFVLLFVSLFAVFLPMYYHFPGVRMTLRESAPGALFAAATWSVSSLGFRLYAATSESVQLYGLAGAVLLLLTWIYLGGLALLVGVVLNAVLAGRVDVDYEWVPTGENYPSTGLRR
jgi:membrane protein